MIKEENSSEKNSKIQKSMSHIIEPYNFKFQLLKKNLTLANRHTTQLFIIISILFFYYQLFFSISDLME